MRVKDGGPFKCDTCTDRDREQRNCLNRLELSEDARAVTEYTDEVKAEIKGKKAQKIFGLAGLRLYECPTSYIEAETSATMRAVYLMEATGHMLYAGGIAEQPYWFLEAYEILKTEQAKDLKEKSKNGK